ncbi:unnamed protein product, partial [Ectocarpus sp. 8 AP-2014]
QRLPERGDGLRGAGERRHHGRGPRDPGGIPGEGGGGGRGRTRWRLGQGVCPLVPQVQDGGVVGGCRGQEEEHSSGHQEGHPAAQDESKARVR